MTCVQPKIYKRNQTSNTSPYIIQESFLSILTSEPWTYDLARTVILDFEPDGTGRMYYYKEAHLRIASEIIRKPTTTDMDTLNKTTINTTPSHNPSSSPTTNTLHYIHNTILPQSLVVFDIEIRLTINRAPDPSAKNPLNESYLTLSAFQPKTFTVRLEKGLFVTPEVADAPGRYPTAQLYMLRLVFDGPVVPGRGDGGFGEFVARRVGGYWGAWGRCGVM